MTFGLYCRACGLKCLPKCRVRGVESYDEPGSQGRLVREFVSDCCGYAMSEAPVTPVCNACGKPCHVDDPPDTLVEVDGMLMCPSCHRDYRRDHPDLENVISMAEYRKER